MTIVKRELKNNAEYIDTEVVKRMVHAIQKEAKNILAERTQSASIAASKTQLQKRAAH